MIIKKKPSYLLAFYAILLFQLALFLFISFRPFTLTPEGHHYAIIDKNFFYPNLIHQGRDGAWKIIDSHTTRFSPYIILQTFFIVLGKISYFTGIHPVWMYLFSRIGTGILMFFTSLWFIQKLIPVKYRLAAVLFVMFIESGPLYVNLPELKPLFEGRMLLIRHFGLAHHIFAHAMGMMYIGFLFLLHKKITHVRLIGLIITGLLSTVAMPAYTFTFILAVFPVWTIWALFHKQLKTTLPILIFACIIIGIPNLIFSHEYTKGQPWLNTVADEKMWFSTPYIRMEYLSTYALFIPGLALLLILFPIIWKRTDTTLHRFIILMLTWFIAPIGLVVLAKTSWFPIPNHRLTDNYSFLPAGILTGISITTLFTLFKHKIWKLLVISASILIFFVPSLYLSNTYFKQLLATQEVIDIHVYPTTAIWDGLNFIDSLPKNSGILSREFFGELIPGFANVRVFIGGIHNFPDWRERQWLATKFFRGDFSTQEAKDFLKANDISYVFYGPDEKYLNSTPSDYPTLLSPIYNSSDLTIFKVVY